MSKLNPNKLELEEFTTRRFTAEPEYGETLQDVMQSIYWSHCAVKLQAGSEITVKPVGLPWYARLIVVQAEPNRAVVKLLEFVDLSDEQKLPAQAPMITEVVMGKFKAERLGAWIRVIRVEDKTVMKTGFRTFAEAKSWASDNLQVELT